MFLERLSLTTAKLGMTGYISCGVVSRVSTLNLCYSSVSGFPCLLRAFVFCVMYSFGVFLRHAWCGKASLRSNFFFKLFS
jgi:hypothetical protein